MVNTLSGRNEILFADKSLSKTNIDNIIYDIITCIFNSEGCLKPRLGQLMGVMSVVYRPELKVVEKKNV